MNNQAFKSVHITNYYHKNSGGISTAYNNLLEAANQYKRFVRLIVPGEIEEIEEIGEFGRIYYVPAKPFPFFDKRYKVMLPWESYMYDETPFRRILFAEMPDMIEIAEKYSLTLLAGMIRMGYMKPLKRPMLVHFTCERMDDNMQSFVSRSQPFMWFARRVMGNYNFPMFDFHLANSAYTAQELLDAVSLSKNPRRSDRFLNFCWQYFRASRTPVEERVHVCSPGINLESFAANRRDEILRRQLFTEIGISPEATVLLFAGRISPEKNVGLLPAMMRVLARDEKRDFQLLVVGSGPSEQLLKKQLTKDVPGKFKMLGHLTNRAKLADLYANVDVFVHPNPREPFGLGPLEAMASGTPVVVPNAGGVLSYATNENSWLAAPNGTDFAAAVQEAVSHPESRKFKVNNALQTAKENTWQASTAKIFALYDKMYEDFCNRKELFDYQTAPKEINFARELLTEAVKNPLESKT